MRRSPSVISEAFATNFSAMRFCTLLRQAGGPAAFSSPSIIDRFTLVLGCEFAPSRLRKQPATALEEECKSRRRCIPPAVEFCDKLPVLAGGTAGLGRYRV